MYLCDPAHSACLCLSRSRADNGPLLRLACLGAALLPWSVFSKAVWSVCLTRACFNEPLLGFQWLLPNLNCLLSSGAASSAESLITGQPDFSAAASAATQRPPARDAAAAAGNATRTRVFLDIAPFGDDVGGRLELELYSDIVPATAQNFKQLCTGEHGLGSSGKPLHYKGAAPCLRGADRFRYSMDLAVLGTAL